MRQERIGLFIDGANIYAAARRLGWNFDHRKILEHFGGAQDAAGDTRLHNAFYYTAVPSTVDDKQRRFIDALTYMGYTVRTRALREVTGENGETYRHANLDIELVTDLLSCADQYDTAVLLSGDGSFERPAEVLRARGKRVVVASIPEMMSTELRNAADAYVDLSTIRAEIERPGYRLPSENGRGENGRAEGGRGENGRGEGRAESGRERPFYAAAAADSDDR